MIGKIYKITNTVNDMVYIGCTRDKLTKRWSGHKSDAKRYNYANSTFYKDMLEFGFDKFSIHLIEEREFKDRKEMYNRELEVILEYDSLKNGYNHRKYGFDIKQWNEENRERIRENHRRHEDKNREVINERHRKAYAKDPKHHVEQVLKSREKNKQAYKDYMKHYHAFRSEWKRLLLINVQ